MCESSPRRGIPLNPNTLLKLYDLLLAETSFLSYRWGRNQHNTCEVSCPECRGLVQRLSWPNPTLFASPKCVIGR